MNTKPQSSPFADTNHDFGLTGWVLAVGIATIWGSSFLLIDIVIRYAPSPFVSLARSAFGAIALAIFPGATSKIARPHVGRLVILGSSWMALPFLLFPMAEKTVASSIAGMMNGAIPVVAVAVTSFWYKMPPTRKQGLAVVIGFAGIVLIVVPSIRDGVSADSRGMICLGLAVLCYAVSINIARPLQLTYAPANLMFWVCISSVTWSTPLGILALKDTSFNAQLLFSTVALGAINTGLAFMLYGILLRRTGIVRSMIPTYFTPVIGLALGAFFNNERIAGLSVLGMAIVSFGAWLASRLEPNGV